MSEPRLSWPRPPLAATRHESVTPLAVHRRLSFSSSRSREMWEPRLAKLSVAALATELSLIATGAVPAAMVWCPYENLADVVDQLKRSGLAWKAGQPVAGPFEPSDQGSAGADPLTQLTYSLLISAAGNDLDILAADTDSAVDRAILFGYPPCCAAAWARSLEAGKTDPIAALLADPAWVGQGLSTGVLLGTLGLGPVRHMPCGPGCDASREAAALFIDTMASLGFAGEAGWLADMMQWRAEASIVGGVAEVRTGAFRFAYQSDPSGEPARLLAGGTSTPEGAPSGLAAIFASPASRSQTRAGSAADTLAPIDEGSRQAGFETGFAHRSRWSCVVWEQSRALRKSRTALHLGCGSGLLLELIVQSRPSIRVCGIEADPALAARARERLGSDASMIVEADWMEDVREWRAEQGSFDLAFVDPEPLLDMPPDARGEIVARLAGLARSLVLIATDRAMSRFGHLDAMAETLGFAPAPGREHRISCLLVSTELALATV